MYQKKEDCCGCSACYAVCPQKAIVMQADEEGFLYPRIDEEKCVDCGMCRNVCAFQNGYNGNSVLEAYALKHRNEQIRMNSRSGGAFTMLSDWVLSQGGVIYGAEFKQDFSVHHARADSEGLRSRFRGSKYAQSEMEDSFALVRKDLRRGIPVLFTGTACQVAGLNQYLKACSTDVSQLYTADIVCHGVPSNKLWNEYLSYVLKKKNGSSIEKADFRDKTFGWATHYESIWVDDQKYSAQDFTLLFTEACIMRPSCYSCKYTNINRPADFTLGDFWGIDDVVEDFNDNKGVSLFLVNSEKGSKLFNEIRGQAECRSVDVDRCSAKNPNLRFPTQRPSCREWIWKIYAEKGFEKMLVKARRINLTRRIKRKILKFLHR